MNDCYQSQSQNQSQNQLKQTSYLKRLNFYSMESEPEMRALWGQQDGHLSVPDPHHSNNETSILLPNNQGLQRVCSTSNGNGGSNREYVMEVEVGANDLNDLSVSAGPPEELHHPVNVSMSQAHAQPQLTNSFPLHQSYINYTLEATPKRKFCSLTQRRKKVVDKYIHEVLTKSHEYDYGEFGSSLWSALLLEYFREDKDQNVGIDSIMHWARHTSWGRRTQRAYEIGIYSIKEGRNPVREYELAKHQAFLIQKRSTSPSPPGTNEKCFKLGGKGRGRMAHAMVAEPDPTVVNGLLNDHGYCKNPWLEAFGEVYTLPLLDSSDRIYDMEAIGGEVEI